MGKCPIANISNSVNSFHISIDIHLADALKRFWKSEEMYYIPFYSVLKPDSKTTKIMVVFDAYSGGFHLKNKFENSS